MIIDLSIICLIYCQIEKFVFKSSTSCKILPSQSLILFFSISCTLKLVTTSQLQIVQSSITCLLSTVFTVVTVKVDDTNNLIWHFQMQILLESHGILGFVDGSRKCPSRFDADSDLEGVETDDHLISLLIS